MTFELLLAGFIMAVGLSMAGSGTYFYQWVAGQQAILRYDGKTWFHMMGHLVMSFVCGPYIMLHMGWQHEEDSNTLSMTSALIGALVAFTWAFVTGLFFLSMYVTLLR